ncbi:MAG: PQQ-binding-like beta-propeller repeat protein [Phycisphaerae bacterium]
MDTAGRESARGVISGVLAAAICSVSVLWIARAGLSQPPHIDPAELQRIAKALAQYQAGLRENPPADPEPEETPAAAPAAPADPPRALRLHRRHGDPSFRTMSNLTHVMCLPDRKQIITCDSDGVTLLWDAATGKEIRRFLEESSDYVWDSKAVPDRDEILTACYDGWVSRWDLNTGKRLAKYEPQTGSPIRLAVSPTGESFAIGATGGGCEIWSLKTGRRVRSLKLPERCSTYSLCFAMDGKCLVTGGDDSTVRVFDVDTGKATVLLKPPMRKDEDGEMVPDRENGPGTIQTISPGPEGHQVFLCTGNQSLQLWDIRTGKKLWALDRANYADVLRCSLSPDGRTVAAVCESSDSILLVDPATGKVRKTIELDDGCYNYAMAFSHDSSTVYCSQGRCLSAFEVSSGRRIFPADDAPLMPYGYHRLGSTDSGKILVTADRSEVLYFDTEKGKLLDRILPGGRIESIAVALDTPAAAVLTGQVVQVVQPGSKPRNIPVGEDRSIGGVRISASGKTIMAYPSYGGWVSFHSAKSGKAVNSAQVGEEVEDAQVSPGGDSVLVLSDDYIHIFEMTGGQSIGRYKLPFKQEESSGNRRLTAIGQPLVGVLLAANEKLYFLKSPDTKGSEFSRHQMRQLIVQLDDPSYQKRQQASEKLVAAGPAAIEQLLQFQPHSPEASLRLANVIRRIKKLSLRYTLAGSLPVTDLRSLAASPDGKTWAAQVGLANEGKIILGTVEGGKLRILQTLHEPNWPEHLHFLPDGSLATANYNGTISIYRIDQPGK